METQQLSKSNHSLVSVYSLHLLNMFMTNCFFEACRVIEQLGQYNIHKIAHIQVIE